MKYYWKTTFSFVLAFSFVLGCQPQKPSTPQEAPIGNRKSPIAISSVKHENTYIKIVYGQPYRRDRVIFGEWEPYGEVWRTGANEATEITITNTIRIADETIEAGTYALFSIPREDKWTLILNNGLGQWGAFDYNQELDYIRFDVPITKLETPVEAFSIEFDEVNMNMTNLVLQWDLVRIELPIRFY